MIVTLELNIAQTMAAMNAMAWFEGDSYVDFGTRNYGFYYDEEGVERHGYFNHPPTLRNTAGNCITIHRDTNGCHTLVYVGSRNAPWVGGGNSISSVFKAAGIINYVGGERVVMDEFRHIFPQESSLPRQEWWRHSYYQYWSGATISNYVVEGKPPALPYDEYTDQPYKLI